MCPGQSASLYAPRGGRVSHGTSFLAPGSLARRRLARVIRAGKNVPPVFSDTRQWTVFYVFLHAKTPPTTPTSAARRRTARATGVDLRPPLPVALVPSLLYFLRPPLRPPLPVALARLRACSIAVAVACSSRNRRCSAQRHQHSKHSCRCCCCCSLSSSLAEGRTETPQTRKMPAPTGPASGRIAVKKGHQARSKKPTRRTF